MNKDELLSLVQVECKKAGINFIIGEDENVIYGEGIACSGYFCDIRMELAVATGVDESEWFPILIHEYNHMLQWQENCPEWNLTKQVGELDTWLDGSRTLTKDEIDSLAMAYLEVELDCERRTVEFIKCHGIDIDTKIYAKRANSYVYFYHMIGDVGRFYHSDRKPYRIEAVWGVMPDHFNNDYSTLPNEYRMLYERHCF